MQICKYTFCHFRFDKKIIHIQIYHFSQLRFEDSCIVNQDPLKIYLISKQGQNFFNGPLVYGLLLLLTLTTVHWNSAHIAHIMSSYKTKLCHFSLCYNHNTSQISTSSRRVQGHKLCQVLIHLQNLGSSQLANHLVNEINQGPCYVKNIETGVHKLFQKNM